MGRGTYIVLIVILTLAMMFAFGAIALADAGSLTAEDAGSLALKQAGTGAAGPSSPSLANNINPAPGDTATGGAAGGTTAGGDPAGGDTAGSGSPGTLSGFILASNGNPSATVPSSGNTTTGAAAGMFGDPVHGLSVYSMACMGCHGAAGQPTLAFPGLADVQNPNPSFSIDPELFDVNPAWFARNIDPFLQHGSNPVGSPQPMPAFGDNNILTQSDIADGEAYIMSLSNVNWPSLALSGSVLTGSGFWPQSTVQLYVNGVAFGAPIVIDGSGRFMQTMLDLVPGGVVTANYAILNVPGIFPNGNPEGGELGLDADRGAALTVARAIQPAPAAPAVVLAAALPSTGANLTETGQLALLLVLSGAAMLASASVRDRKYDRRHQ
ncbi:MAG: cytochrome c [Actinobacteria bacterium]|nr:cytochrome c [Actinomycetota bacterium]